MILGPDLRCLGVAACTSKWTPGPFGASTDIFVVTIQFFARSLVPVL